MTEIQAEAQANDEQISQDGEGNDIQQGVMDDPIVQSVGDGVNFNMEDGSTLDGESIDSTDWEREAKKFQSLYDKSQVDTKEYERLQSLSNFLETRPDLIQMLQDNIVAKQPVNEESALSEEEFNPWDAYYKPDSPSFHMRNKMEQKSINKALEGYTNKVEEQVFMNNTVNELKNIHKMEESEVNEFLKWSTKPTEELGLNTLVKVWKESSGNNNKSQSNIEAVRQSKNVPRSAGSFSGAGVAQKSNIDKIWEGVVNAGSRSDVL